MLWKQTAGTVFVKLSKFWVYILDYRYIETIINRL